MGRFLHFLETYHAGFTRKMYGKENHADVYKDPSHKELHASSHDGNTLAWLHHSHMYSFNPHHTRHYDVKPHIGINHHDKHEGIALDIHHHKKEAHVTVTDSTKNSKWHHNPDLKKHIENHPQLKKHFKKVHVNYYDEDIHGPWHEMKHGA